MTITMTKTAYRGHQVASLRGIGQPAADDDLLDSIPVEAPGSDPTPAQATLMAKLIGELLELDRNAWQLAIDYTARMSGRWTPGREGNASRWIDRLLVKVKELRAARGPVELEDGVYLLDGEYLMVQHAVHGSGRQYAKRLILPEDPELDEVRAEYVGAGPLKLLRPEHLVTGEQAAAFGQVYGTCVFCVRPLTDERSKAVGYGKTCAGHRGLPWG